MYPLSATYYGLLLLCNIFILDFSQKLPLKLRAFLQKVSISMIVVFCSLRFFVGNDYKGYYRSYNYLLNQNPDLTDFFWEPGFFYIAKFLTVFGDIGYIFLLFVSSAITFIFIYVALKEQGSLKWGLFFVMTLGLMIMVNDQVRQGIALGIFLFSIKFIRNEQLSKFLICITLAFLFHYSALILVFVYYIRFIKLSKFWWVVLISGTYLGFQLGVFYETIFKLIELIPHYGDLYITRQKFFEIELGGSGLSILFRNVLAFIFIISLSNINSNIYAKIYLTGLVLGNIVVGFMPAERVTYFLYYVHIFAFPMLLNTNKKIGKQLFYFIVLLSLVFFTFQNLFGLEKHGAIPYRTIFFENLSNPPRELIYGN